MTSCDTAVVPQAMHALELANRVRAYRADLKRRIATGEVEAAEIVLVCPRDAAGMTIAELLLAQRSWGRVRCVRFLRSLSLREDKTVGSMTERQRRSVAVVLSLKS
jgi:hypothetical protein